MAHLNEHQKINFGLKCYLFGITGFRRLRRVEKSNNIQGVEAVSEIKLLYIS